MEIQDTTKEALLSGLSKQILRAEATKLSEEENKEYSKAVEFHQHIKNGEDYETLELEVFVEEVKKQAKAMFTDFNKPIDDATLKKADILVDINKFTDDRPVVIVLKNIDRNLSLAVMTKMLLGERYNNYPYLFKEVCFLPYHYIEQYYEQNI